MEVEHPDIGNLGEYAQIVHERGTQRAMDLFPDIYDHVDGCEECSETVDLCLRALGDDSWV